MTLFTRIYTKITTFEKRVFFQSVGIFFGTVLFLIGALIFYYYASVHTLRTQITKTKRQQEEVRRLLGSFTQLQEEIKKVNAVLEEEKNFKIKNFYESILQQHNLQDAQLREAEVQEENLRNRYTEIKLTSNLHQISTENLCTILDALEKKARIYVKTLTVTKTRNNALDVILVIATLKVQLDQK